MDPLVEMLTIFKDPAVQEWGHRVIDAARDSGYEPAVDEGLLHGVIEDPARFDTDEGAVLWWEFWQAYGAAVIKSKHLVAQSQPFASQFRIFRQDPRQVLAEEFQSSIESSLLPTPSEFELARHFRDIAESANRLRLEISGIRDSVSSPHLKERLGRLDADLGEIVGGSWLTGERERLFEINETLADVQVILDMDRGVLFEKVADMLRNMMFTLDFASGPARKRLGELRALVMKGLASGKTDDDEIYEAAAEMSIRISNLLRAAVNAGMLPRDMEQLLPGDEPMSFEALSVAAGAAIMSMGGRRDVLVRMAELEENPLRIGAALLDAAFRRRMGVDSKAYVEEMAPFIRGVLMKQPQRVPDGGGEAPQPAGGVEGDDISSGKFEDWLFDALESNVPMRLVLGSGEIKAGLDHAAEHPDDRIFSVDPKTGLVAEADSVPSNFVSIAGRAERLVPYFFKRPLFEGALMVAPPAHGWASMMLAALLAVRPGGTVRIYKSRSREFSLDFLDRAGFDVVKLRCDGGDPDVPLSNRFRPGVPVHYIWIRVPQLGGDPCDGSADGPGGGGGVVRSGSQVLRSITRRRSPALRGLAPASAPAAPGQIISISRFLRSPAKSWR